ncbi:hypothetical protein [Pseudoclavibacter sp. CFCC 11306]|uniref:hypothetical protein n=1 Tax=Pseudoclavibacter sp. CFCC 11306 TaxID=1564493 RepID=UPI001300FD7B|nr:hypothetical protein [Pseudoclavibacter sp. CFCC 11306]KAB1658225.1 hypothetical protein F8O09_00920 [Pseudoclavibacter sp. CFCC 11306]
MGKVFWFIVGIGTGFLVAHKVSQTEKGQAFFAEVNDFTDTVARSFQERTAEVREAIDDLQDELRDAAQH